MSLSLVQNYLGSHRVNYSAGLQPALVIAPFQGLLSVHHKPKALPWAVTFGPFGALNQKPCPCVGQPHVSRIRNLGCGLWVWARP